MESAASLYSPERFEAWSSVLIAEIHRQYCASLESTHPFQNSARAGLVDEARALLRERSGEPAENLKRLTDLFFRALTRMHSPHTFGHQVSAPVPLAASIEWLSAIFNPALGIYELGNFSIAAEKALIEMLGEKIGWRGLEFDGIVTGGGSLANMTGILSARQRFRPSAWRDGVTEKLGIIVSGESHYSVARAAGIIGTGVGQVYKASVDDDRRMRLSDVRAAYAQAQTDGVAIFAVVGSACTTPTGAFDHLDEIGAWCREQGIWFHVDAAHGGGFLFSPRFAPLLHGVHHADSITWDAHKMMGVSSLSTFVMFRSKADSFRTFQQDAPYLFASAEAEAMEFEPAQRTLECTRRAMGLAPYALLVAHGEESISMLCDGTIALTAEFHDMLLASEDFSPLHHPQCNILCFRYEPTQWRGLDAAEISSRQRELRRRVLERGRFYITGTVLDGQYCLRVTIMNPLTTRAHLADLLSEVRTVATAWV